MSWKWTKEWQAQFDEAKKWRHSSIDDGKVFLAIDDDGTHDLKRGINDHPNADTWKHDPDAETFFYEYSDWKYAEALINLDPIAVIVDLLTEIETIR